MIQDAISDDSVYMVIRQYMNKVFRQGGIDLKTEYLSVAQITDLR